LVQSLVREDPELVHTEALSRAVQRFQQLLPDVGDVMIYDLEGRIIADSDPENFPGSKEFGPQSLLKAGQGEIYYVTESGKFYRAVEPLFGAYDATRKSDVIGTISIDIPISPVDRQIGRNVLRDIGLRVVLLSLFAILLYTFTRRVFVRPLLELAAAADRFGKTGFSPPVHITAATSSRRSRNRSTGLSRNEAEATSYCALGAQPTTPIARKANSWRT
jgi:sensor histidine kinase regulating citrate/malate metabolism